VSNLYVINARACNKQWIKSTFLQFVVDSETQQYHKQ